MDASQYLDRIGLSPADVRSQDVDTLARLQRAHVTSVPFENIAITGPPGSEAAGPGVSLALSDLYEKFVVRERGGFCYELNGLFGWLLAELDFEVTRVAGRVVDAEGRARPPANHLTSIVTLDRRYVVDVGVAIPTMRQPVPLDGTPMTDDAGVTWRLVPSERPDADYRTEIRSADSDAWTTRYVFRDVPRDIDYVTATCEYLTTAPESPFTGDPFVTIATDDGHLKLKHGTLSRSAGAELTEDSVPNSEWSAVVAAAFGLEYAASDGDA